MRRLFLRLAAVSVVAAATLTGTALAAGNPNAHGQEKKDDASASAQQAPTAPIVPTTPATTGHEPPGQAKRASVGVSASVQAGVKPGSTTTKWTHCKTGGAGGGAATCTAQAGTPNVGADVSKRYGNGTTAAQIAVARGEPDGTLITGPGNSQPHMVSACGKPSNKSGGVDVHAIKSYSSSACAQASAATTAQTQATITPARVVLPSVHPATPVPSVAPATQTPAAAPVHNVLGAQATLTSPRPASGHGVLGTVTRIGGSTLPFTGFRLWLVALAAMMLTGAGVAVRRAA